MSEDGQRSDRERVLAVLRAAQKFVVVTHEHPDGDALGSLVAMQQILSSCGRDSVMFIDPADLPVPQEYDFLELPRLIDVPPEDVGARTIVFLDCGNIERTPGQVFQRLGAQLVNIDHHHDNTRFGTINYVRPDASCTAEIVWELMRELGVELRASIAEALYVGLITDTGRFMYENTGPRAHLMAAELIDAGVDVHEVYRRVYEDVPYAKVVLLARGLQKIERYDGGRLTVSALDIGDFTDAGAEASYSEGLVDLLRAVRGTVVAALVRERAGDGDGQPQHKVSLRSSDDSVDVSRIARVQGGGGHRQAAGFSTGMSHGELVRFLRDEIAAQL